MVKTKSNKQTKQNVKSIHVTKRQKGSWTATVTSGETVREVTVNSVSDLMKRCAAIAGS